MKFKKRFPTLLKLISLLHPEERMRATFVILLVLLLALLDMMGIASVLPFLAVLGNPNLLETNSYIILLHQFSKGWGVNNVDSFLMLLGLASFFMLIVSSVYRIMTHYYVTNFVEMSRHTLSIRLLENYLRQPYHYFLNRNSGTMSTIILSEVDQLIGNIMRPTFSMISGGLIAVAVLIFLMIVNIYLAIFTIFLLGGFYIFVYYQLRKKLQNIGEVRVRSNESRFLFANEIFGGIKTVKLLGNEKFYINKYDVVSKEFSRSIASQHFYDQLPKYIIEAMAFGGIILTILVMMNSYGGLSNNFLGEILPLIGLYTFAAYRLQPALQAIFQGFASLKYGQAALDVVYADLNPKLLPESCTFTELEDLTIQKCIAFNQVWFNYVSYDKPALIDLNLKVPIGKSVGIVGLSGSGKTTFLDILLGLIRPTSGHITVDGVELTQSNLRSWQRCLGYVPQDIFLTDATINENIAYGVLQEEIDQEQVIVCAKMAHLHDFIVNELPCQYDTKVGERGVRLSGGQRQRLGIARALYRNPEILIFDEATSALDNITEQSVMDAIDELSKHKTIFIVAHRLSTVKKCDMVVLMNNGSIEAVGGYDQLEKKSLLFISMLKKSSESNLS